MKQTRYYRIEDGMLYVYDAPYADRSVSVSIVSKKDIAWYRARFDMQKLSGDVCPECYR